MKLDEGVYNFQEDSDSRGGSVGLGEGSEEEVAGSISDVG